MPHYGSSGPTPPICATHPAILNPDVIMNRLTRRFLLIGAAIATTLSHAGVPFVVVDIDPDRAERAMLAGMLAVAADSTQDETLRLVGIERARGLVAALATDADNLFVLLSAKGLNPNIYVSTRAAEEGAEAKMRRP